MANKFVNTGNASITTGGDVIYTCANTDGTQCLIHALYLSNTHATDSVNVTVEVTVNGVSGTPGVLGSTYIPIAMTVPVPADSTLILDKPLNLEPQDSIKVTSSANSKLAAFASILEIT
jgi:hypothetical protein